MDFGLTLYFFTWLILTIVALTISFRLHHKLTIFTLDYLKFISTPWKLITFLIAISGMTLIAPYTGDPTWDYVDAIFMSLLTWYSAPWVIGTFYHSILKKVPLLHTYVALCYWLFSVSWSYDLYILVRDGIYPATWWSNLMLSSVLYICAGLMWNLEVWPNHGMKFGFMRDDWPKKLANSNVIKIFWFALPFMILVAALILSFVVPIPFLSD